MWLGPIGCPETSVRNYHHSLRNNPEESSSQLFRGGRLKSCKDFSVHTMKVLDRGEWSNSRSGRFFPGKEPSYPLNNILGGP